MMSQTLSFVVLHDCLEDAAYALQVGQPDQAVACLETARNSLKELVTDLIAARRQISELEELLSHTTTPASSASTSELIEALSCSEFMEQ